MGHGVQCQIHRIRNRLKNQILCHHSIRQQIIMNILLSQQSKSMESVSSKKTADTGLLHKNHSHDEELEVKHSGFIAIGGTNNTLRTGSRPSRSPTPISDADASILIEKTTGCSCFGWFGKKKKKKNVGLAQQELR